MPSEHCQVPLDLISVAQVPECTGFSNYLSNNESNKIEELILHYYFERKLSL